MASTVKCATCGSVIKIETGETKFSKDDVAFSVEKLKEDNERLREEIKTLKEALSGSKGKTPEDVPGKDEDDDYFI